MTNNQNFGQALEALKEGKSVAREGWNGKGMQIWLNWGNLAPENTVTVKDGDPVPLIEGIQQPLFVMGNEDTVTRLPNLNMKAATGSTVTGWLASQTDILAEDWCILD